ncbi:hypothetical protein C8Q74DRAFT_920808 [Fomes fomentarius]|nr:hypothetical protein C8Q74DRAFT_920808 [Fomes fomentarius]
MAPAPSSTTAEQDSVSTMLIVTIVLVPGEWSFLLFLRFPFFTPPRLLIPSVPHPVIVITAVILLWLCVIRKKGWLCTARPVSGPPSPATSRGRPSGAEASFTRPRLSTLPKRPSVRNRSGRSHRMITCRHTP